MTFPRLLATLALLVAVVPSARAADAKPAAGPATAPAGPKFENEIEAFEAADRKKAPPPGAVLFTGSSSIRLWKTLAEDFPGVPVLNRGFGGATVPDVLRYTSRIVTPYKPRLIVFYCGDNDINAGRTPEQVAADTKTFVETVRKDLPDTRILILGCKPSPSRWKHVDKQREANRLLREYVAAGQNLGYVDVFTPMLGDDGKPRPELFVADNLHMNRKGYEVWTSILAPLVKDATDPAAAKPAK